MERRQFLAGLGGVAGLAAAGSVGVLVGHRGHGAGSTDPPARTPKRTTKALATRDLAEQVEISGTLGYGNPRDLALAAHGTITDLPAVGAVVDRNGELAEVDGTAVVLLFGDRPAWRPLPPPPDAPGADVQQLEANLIALGHGKASVLGPNETWSESTAASVRAWQKKLGLAQTGTVDLGRIVFEPGPVRVAKHLAEVGAPAGGPVLQISDTTRTVHVDLAATRQSDLHVGDLVGIVLPSGGVTPAKVATIGTVATAGEQGSSATLPVELTLTDPGAVGGLDQAPVTVRVTTSSANAVLAAPVEALLALAEGGYALEVVTGPTTSKLVGVTLGPSADGWVQVTGAVHAGDEVVVAP